MTADHVHELALGLELSDVRFLWALRPLSSGAHHELAYTPEAKLPALVPDGKFKNLSRAVGLVHDGNTAVAGGGIITREEGETSSSSSLDSRRCFSMGSY
ncbi:hypothetical protein ABZP36_014923 [Zizania latifolia]